MRNIILIGAGGHADSCIDVIECENKYNILGLIDMPEKVGQFSHGYKIIDTDENIKKYIAPNTYFLITIGQIRSAKRRVELFDYLKQNGANLATVISPRAYVSRHSIIEEGTIVMHDAVVNIDASVGKNCIINTKALIEHGAKVGSHCHISTAAVLNGGVSIGDKSFIGSNATIVQALSLPESTFVKAGEMIK